MLTCRLYWNKNNTFLYETANNKWHLSYSYIWDYDDINNNNQHCTTVSSINTSPTIVTCKDEYKDEYKDDNIYLFSCSV